MIGPTLPPHLQKSQQGDETNREDELVADSPRPTMSGPQLPPHLQNTRETERKRKREEDEDSERTAGPSLRRHIGPTMGPSLPPPVETSADSDSDSDVGPSISAMMTPAESAEYERKQAIQRLSRTSPPHNSSTSSKSEPKPQRDSWMLAPPTRQDWLTTLDASKLKARTFNQSKSGNAQGNPDHTLWTETPMERAQRLEDEAQGRRSKKAVEEEEVEDEAEKAERMERDRRIKEYNERTRGPSLMDRHSATKKNEDDDPSKRGFDWQKDMAGGGNLGFKERNKMMERAKNLDSKYSGGHYL